MKRIDCLPLVFLIFPILVMKSGGSGCARPTARSTSGRGEGRLRTHAPRGRAGGAPAADERERRAEGRTGLTKRASCQILRHFFAHHLRAEGCDIGAAQELLGHSDAKTTMIYTHLLNRDGKRLRSRVNGL